MPPFDVTFLQDGAQSAEQVVDLIGGFIASADRSVDVAIYDFDARAGTSARLADALEEALARGVTLRVIFNVDRSDAPSAPRPMIADPGAIDGLEVPTHGLHDRGALMHHKYAIADGARVLTGSTNWTDDAFTREENVIVTVEDPSVAAAYETNFDELWRRDRLEGSGARGPQARSARGISVTPWFLPEPPSVAHLAAERIGAARRRLRVCSPVVTSGPVLGTLAEFAGRDAFDLDGAYDATQMDEVLAQWADVPWNRWKVEAWGTIAARLSGKRSTPYRPGSVHDYLHAKFVVSDDEVLVGSYNLSRGGEENAENVLHVVNEEVAVRFASFADRVAARYRSPALPPPPA